MTATVHLADLRCRCGSADIIAVAPGTAPVMIGSAVVDDVPGQDPVAICLACWPALHGHQQALFAEAVRADRLPRTRRSSALKPPAPLMPAEPGADLFSSFSQT